MRDLCVSRKCMSAQLWLCLVRACYEGLKTKIPSVQEIIPSLIRVLQQPIRAVAVNLFTRAEKRALASSVSTLLSYGISFDTSSTEASTDGLALKPEIHTLCHFEVRFLSALDPSTFWCRSRPRRKTTWQSRLELAMT